MSADMRLLGLAPSSPDGYYTPMSRRLFDAIKDSSLIQVISDKLYNLEWAA